MVKVHVLFFLIAVTSHPYLAWDIKGLKALLERHSRCTIAVQLVGSTFNFPQVSTPLTLFRTKENDVVPTLRKTQLTHRSRCITFFHVLPPGVGFTTLLIKHTERKWNQFGNSMNAYYLDRFVRPSNYFLMVFNYKQLQVVVRHRDMFLARVFVIFLTQNSTTQELNFWNASYLCPFCKFTPHQIHQTSFYPMISKPIILMETNLDHDMFEGSSNYFQNEHLVAWIRLNRPTCGGIQLLRHFLRQFSCIFLKSESQIHQTAILLTLFRTMSYNYTEKFKSEGIISSQHHPLLFYGGGGIRQIRGSQINRRIAQRISVSSIAYNFVTCYGSYHLLSFGFYLQPFDFYIWITLGFIGIFLGIIITRALVGATLNECVYLLLRLGGSLLGHPIDFVSLKGGYRLTHTRILMLWIVMGITINGSYKGIIVSDLIRPSVDYNLLESFWNLTDFKIFTPGFGFLRKSANEPYASARTDNSCKRELRNQTKLFKIIDDELNKYIHSKYNSAHLKAIRSRIYRCPESTYKAIAIFKKTIGPNCRHQKMAFVHTSKLLTLSLRWLNQGLRGEPYKIWTQPLFDEETRWHTYFSTGNYVRRRIHQLICTGVEKFWRDLQSFIDTRDFLRNEHKLKTNFYVVTMHGNIVTAFYFLIGTSLGIAVLIFGPECLRGVTSNSVRLRKIG